MDGYVGKRNLFAHTYDEVRFEFAINKIKVEYYDAISQAYSLRDKK